MSWKIHEICVFPHSTWVSVRRITNHPLFPQNVSTCVKFHNYTFYFYYDTFKYSTSCTKLGLKFIVKYIID